MTISIDKIKDLREKCGAGMVDCKKALEESEGDLEKALEHLRKKGIAKAAKRGERDASEGMIKIGVNELGNTAYITEIKSETDFVSRSDRFQDFATHVLEALMKNEPSSLEDLFGLRMDDGHTVKENLDSLSGVIGEKLEIKRFEILKSNGTVSAYSHLGGRIGALVAIDLPGQNELAYEIAMQIAASNPRCVSRNEIPTEDLDKEKEIYREQLLNEKKPENMIDNIIIGKLNKYFEEVCLEDQEFIKDDKKKIKDILNGARIEKFVRYSL
jgi:elongation factor Ts